MSDLAIGVRGISKSFKLPHEKLSSVKGLFIGLFTGKRAFEKQHVLKNIDFDIQKGDFFGIVGRNGSGKSTLLKLIAGIYSPEKGQIIVNGKLTPFIELGVGFNPELTGRENVFLNGALLGFSRKEMLEMYDSIVEFAELEKFMDQKLKNYSSGMQVRLAFSIAIRAETDILVLDEVLAVGDEAFQQKCIDVFERYKANKKTIVLVTHDMEMVRRFCTKAVLIHDGALIKVGSPRDVSAEYSKLNSAQTQESIVKRNESLQGAAIKLELQDSKAKVQTYFSTFEELTVVIRWPEGTEGVKNLGVAIHKNSGEYIFGDNTFKLDFIPKTNTATYKVKLDIGPGTYYLVAGLFGDKQGDVIEFLPRGPEFMVKNDGKDQIQGLVRLNSDWIV